VIDSVIVIAMMICEGEGEGDDDVCVEEKQVYGTNKQNVVDTSLSITLMMSGICLD